MAKIALVCPPLIGHLNPTAVLGRTLQSRGHIVTFFHIPGVASQVRSQGLPFCPLGPAGTDLLADRIRQLSASSGVRSLKSAIRCSCESSEILCRYLPSALVKESIDLLVVDQNEPAAGSVAEHLGLPFINICPSLPLNREPAIPPPFFGWDFRESAPYRIRNAAGYFIADRLVSPINDTINRHRRLWRLPKIAQPDQSFSSLAQLCQMTADFDFPRRALAKCFHYLGPFVDASRENLDFPFERLTGQPIIYATLGTLQDANSELLRVIARACRNLDAQLVLASGAAEKADLSSDLPSSAVVVKYAPQLEILSRATLTITHAGLNTVMQSLMCATPMVAVPITHDQPAIAARVKHSGTGEVIPAKHVTSERLAAAVKRVISDSAYRRRAQLFSKSISQAGGVEQAALIVEDILARSGRNLKESPSDSRHPSPVSNAFRNH